MKRNRIALIVTIALLSTAFVSVAQAKGRGHGPGGPGGPGMDVFIDELDLTDAQLDAIDDIEDKARADMKKAHDELRALHDQMRALWEKDAVNRKDVMALHSKIQKKQTEMATARLEQRLSIYDQLTPDQKKKASQLIRTRHENGPKGKKGMGGNGPGRGDGAGRCDGNGGGRGPRW